MVRRFLMRWDVKLFILLTACWLPFFIADVGGDRGLWIAVAFSLCVVASVLVYKARQE